MGSSPSVATPDPNSIDQTQEQYNTLSAEEQQAMNMTNQYTPYGSLTYTQTGTGPNGVPTYTATSQLSPQEQYLLGTGQTTQGEAASQAAELLGNANYGSSPDLGNMTQGLTGQMMGEELSSMSPYFNQQNEQLQSQLANQGLTPTDPAYQTAMNNLQQSQNQSMSGFAAQAEPTAFSQALQEYQTPLNVAESLYGMGSPASLESNLINTPETSVGQVNATGAAGVTQSALNQEAQMQMQQYSGMLNGLGTLGAAAILA